FDADPLRISQILSNLLTNAAKYSEPGCAIHLAAAVEGQTLSLSVRDEGIGIAPESIGGIFDMFSQVDAGSGMSNGGLGIGLALVKGLTELHGGTVEARSPGLRRGSEFIVRLPLLPAATARAPVPNAPEVGSVRQKILIADDNHDAAESIAMILGLAGHDVRVANSGHSALELAQSFRPDTALLDIGMPDLSGLEVCRRLRQEAWATGIRLIALTGWGQEHDRRRALESGFDIHLSKPVDPDYLEQLIGGTAATAQV
ncbi:MAG TPA: ATP-binding protein, partial [Caldimonas sp.]|nr:ATP-binding protein [Caldimonas sp.]